MGKLRFVALCLAVAACGSDKATPVDAAIDSPRPIDAKQFFDAPPPSYDLSCFGMTPPTTVDATITVSGETAEVGMGGSSPVGGIDVTVYKVGETTSSASVTSSTTAGSIGAFTTGTITTNGTALEYLKAVDPAATPTYRTTYLYPPFPIRSNIDGVPVALIDSATIGLLAMIGITQDDTNNGFIVVIVNDCSLTDPKGIDGASLTVKQGNDDVGEVLDLGQFFPEAAGTFFVANVPDGLTQLAVSYDGKNFPSKTVRAYKKPAGTGAMGTVTATAMPPGPIL